MLAFINFIHIIVCVGLIVIVLFQADKSEGLAGAFGGGASNTIFGERGSGGFVSNLTTTLAIIFMITSLIISVYGPNMRKSSQNAAPIINYGYDNQQQVPVTATTETAPTPVAETTPAPVENAVVPVETNAAPVESAVAPAETTATPVESTVAPVETIAAPVESTTAPAETTAAPVESSAAPVVEAQPQQMAPTAVAPIAPNEAVPAPAPTEVPVTDPIVQPAAN